MKEISVIILSAGKGTRMQSNLPKVLHKIAGREMLNMVIDEAKKLHPANISVVISSEIEPFIHFIKNQHLDTTLDFILQTQRHGTGHAVKVALKNFNPNLKLHKKVLILYGDTPLISAETLNKMLEKLQNNSVCILGFDDEEPNNYGRLVISDEGNLDKIVEFKDANETERKIALCNSGVIGVDGEILPHLLSQITNDNVAGEYYLTDIVAIANMQGYKCTFIKTNKNEVLGVNSRVELANLEKIKQKQIRQKMMENGVTLISPKSVHFNYDTIIANDVTIHPNVVFGPKVKIESGVEIKSFCHIEDAKIKSQAVIGPFARIRPGTTINENVHIGNFVEIKKSEIGQGTKINHLSYVGDSIIGTNTNIGAGTITCNYDGFNKYQTIIGDNVFIGSNSALIAPIIIEANSIIAAGSVITKNVVEDDLAIARSLQRNIADGANKFRQQKKPK
ncbi:MAG: bifunctional UDP-N-acetylglucosamine diphosphorylase/glucosamine-1-phosphate N-acetyltransferase GlmU [Rickettsiales bacterium]